MRAVALVLSLLAASSLLTGCLVFDYDRGHHGHGHGHGHDEDVTYRVEID